MSVASAHKGSVARVPPGLIPLCLGVTGHRDIQREDAGGVRAAVEVFVRQLAESFPSTPLRLLSPLAEGADRIVAEAFLSVRDGLMAQRSALAAAWELIVPLPCSEARYKLDFPESVDVFDKLKSKANAVIELSSPSDEAATGSEMAAAPDYGALGEYVARHSNILIALWDGTENEALGGTAQVVSLKRDGMSGRTNAHRAATHDCGPVFHIPVRRSRALDVENESNTLLNMSDQGQWLYPNDPLLTRATFEASFRGIDTFNRTLNECVSSEDEIAEAIRGLSPASEQHHYAPLTQLCANDKRLIDLYAAADVLAVRLERKRHGLTRLMYAMAALVALSLWSALDRVFQLEMIIIYLALFGTVGLLAIRLKRPELSDDQYHYRFLAEALRVQIYWSIGHRWRGAEHGQSQGGTSDTFVPRILDGLLAQHFHEIGWVREALRICAIDPNGATHVDAETRAAHVRHWIHGQLDYFQRTERRHARATAILGRISAICYVFGLFAAAAAIGIDISGKDWEHWRHLASICAATLPAIGLLVQSYAEKMAHEEQAKNMVRMQWVFDRARTRLSLAPESTAGLASLLKQLGQEAMTEAVNWLVLKKSRPPSVPT